MKARKLLCFLFHYWFDYRHLLTCLNGTTYYWCCSCRRMRVFLG